MAERRKLAIVKSVESVELSQRVTTSATTFGRSEEKELALAGPLSTVSNSLGVLSRFFQGFFSWADDRH